MKTRYTSLVSVKKNIMQKSERELQSANANLNSAESAYEMSLTLLNDIHSPTSGKISDFLSSRTLLDSQRVIIAHNQEWIIFAKDEIQSAKESLKKSMIEYEKFKYLEVEGIKKILNKRKLQEAKDLDEIALMTYENKRTLKDAS